MTDYLAHRDHLRETADRAIRYFNEGGRRGGVVSSVHSACSTMLFDATAAEFKELCDRVSRSPAPRIRS